MEDFVVKLAIATLYVMIGGGVLVWILNYIIDACEEISMMDSEDWIYMVIGVTIIGFVALII